MTHGETRLYLIKALLDEAPQYRTMKIPETAEDQGKLLRALMNVREPKPVRDDFLRVQDRYLQEEIMRKGVTALADLIPVREKIYLWKGDITTLKCDAIVNAANSGMTGCYVPCHRCIDNAIHTYAGVQLRLECAALMKRQGFPEPTGTAKLTRAHNLPCQYVLHTVGPVIDDKVTERDDELLADCYRSCLELADENNLSSIAFCCISTGEFRFPNERAAGIAVQTVKAYQENTGSKIKIIFNVFKEKDHEIYRKILGISQ